MRSKEEAHDYRYFPDPDLLPLELSPSLVADLQAQLPELPDDKKARFVRDFALSALRRRRAGRRARNRGVLRDDGRRGRRRDPKLAANWVINELVRAAQQGRQGHCRFAGQRAQLGAILDLIADGTISGKIAKDVFEIVWTEGGDPRAIVEARGLKQVTDVSALEKLVDGIIASQSGQGRRRQDQSESDRLVRRPGDEGVGRQSQPASGQRSAARNVSASDRARARTRAQVAATVRQNGGENLARDASRGRARRASGAAGANQSRANSRVLRP